MKKILTICCLICLLTSCATAAIIGGASVGGSLLFDKRGIATITHDRHITQTAQNLINADPKLKGRSHIAVATYDGTTLIVGEAQTNAVKQRAAHLVSLVPGIKTMYNEITIAGATSELQQTNDSWLTSKVKSALLSKAGFTSLQLKIITENNVVFLLGKATKSQAQKAADTARRVPGVTKVVKVFDYS
jgi:osmotically-inducible protein OsmY